MVPYSFLLFFTLSLLVSRPSSLCWTCVWYLDVAIIGSVEDVFGVFELLQNEGPALGLHLNVRKNEMVLAAQMGTLFQRKWTVLPTKGSSSLEFPLGLALSPRSLSKRN